MCVLNSSSLIFYLDEFTSNDLNNSIIIKLDDFINVIKKGSQICNEIKKMLDRYNRLPYNYQSKIGYDNLIQNVILQKLINIMGTTITDLDIESKLKISRIKYLESKYNHINGRM